MTVRKRTDRGFAVFTEFKDLYDNEVRVQKSSLATQRAAWIFTNYPDGSSTKFDRASGGHVAPHPHLTPKMARRLAAALIRFADGEG